MAYVNTLDLEQPLPVTTLTGNGETIIRVPCGYEPDTGYVFSIVTALSPLPGYGDGTGYELTFSVVESDLAETHIAEYWDGLHTRRCIDDPYGRTVIRMAVCWSVAHLIDEVRPPAVEMMTHTANLPDAALRKYHEIAAVFATRGYVAHIPDPYHGRRIWQMRLPE